MSLVTRPFREIEIDARFRFEGAEYQKGGNQIAYPIMDSDDPCGYVFIGHESCYTSIDPNTGKKAL